MSELARKHAVVLLADDDPGDQELTRRALQDDLNRTDLRVVVNGEMALDYLLQRDGFEAPLAAPRPDLVLLDLNMPRVDGREVLRTIREQPDLRRIPVVILTTSKHEEDVRQCYDLGCNSFITKPSNLDGFVQMVRQLGSYWFEMVTLPSM